MGFGYGQRRNRGQELNVKDDLVGYTLGQNPRNPEFEKLDYEIVAGVVNAQLDKAEKQLREFLK